MTAYYAIALLSFARLEPYAELLICFTHYDEPNNISDTLPIDYLNAGEVIFPKIEIRNSEKTIINIGNIKICHNLIVLLSFLY